MVISDVEDCRALERARQASIETAVVSYRGDRSEFTKEICDVADRAGVEALVLAGFMRILGPDAIARFPHRIVNIHPSLLPAFPGVDAVGQALRAGVQVTGVTVHFVDERVDHGPDHRPDEPSRFCPATTRLHYTSGFRSKSTRSIREWCGRWSRADSWWTMGR